MPRHRRKFVFEDLGQNSLPQGRPIPTGEEPGGTYWKDYAEEPPHKLDAAPLRLVIEAEEGRAPTTFIIEVDFDPNWVARHRVQRRAGVWIADDPEITCIGAPDATPTMEQVRRATLERHRQRITQLLQEAIDHQGAIWGDASEWLHLILDEWGLSAPRSRRGRRPKIDLDEVERLKQAGLTYTQMAKRLGVHPKSIGNAVARAARRRPV